VFIKSILCYFLKVVTNRKIYKEVILLFNKMDKRSLVQYLVNEISGRELDLITQMHARYRELDETDKERFLTLLSSK